MASISNSTACSSWRDWVLGGAVLHLYLVLVLTLFVTDSPLVLLLLVRSVLCLLGLTDVAPPIRSLRHGGSPAFKPGSDVILRLDLGITCLFPDLDLCLSLLDCLCRADPVERLVALYLMVG